MSNEVLKEKLNPEQKRGFELLKKGKNTFITGAAGTGKSYLIKIFVEYMKLQNKRVAVTSTTGVSAILIGGCTLHSWSGIRLGELDKIELLDRVKRNKKAYLRWHSCHVLIIDEVSMLSSELVEKLDFIGRQIRENPKPFGGIQLVFTGDFLQLPPINATYLFKNIIWDLLVEEVIYLKENMRQADDIFRKLLNEVRVGNISQENINILENRIGAHINAPEGILPTKLFSHRADVDTINSNNLKALINDQNPLKKYLSRDWIKVKGNFKLDEEDEKQNIARIDKVCNGVKNLEIAIGCQVMLIWNLDVPGGLANGSRGVCIGFMNDLPVVRFMNGIEIPVDKIIWEIKLGEDVFAYREQIPLIISFACTIHKTQGATLDCAMMDLGATLFEYSQGYTALSRCKSLDSISIVTLEPRKLIASPEAIKFYEEIEFNEERNNQKSKNEEKEEKLCNICMDRLINIVLIPCGHCCTCLNCSLSLEICPICRTEIRQFNKVFI